MFNIFEEENEEVSEQAKVCIRLKKVEYPQLQGAVGVLQVCAAIEGISFTECANHLFTQVSELTDQHTPRKVSATGSRAGKKDGEVKRIRGGGPSTVKETTSTGLTGVSGQGFTLTGNTYLRKTDRL